MNETYMELTKTLYKARIESQTANDELKVIRESFEAELSPKKETAKRLTKSEVEAKTALIDYAKLAYKTGTLDADGPVKMNNSTVIQIDRVKALAWARVNMPIAIIETVDEELLKPHTKNNPDWAEVIETKKPIVATDLSRFVKDKEQK